MKGVARTWHGEQPMKHDSLAEYLAQRLREAGSYRSIFICQEYRSKVKGNSYRGEYDVHAVTESGEHHYYEVKTWDSSGQLNKAIDQFKRNNKAHPNQRWKNIYVTNEIVRRIRTESDLAAICKLLEQERRERSQESK
jgi:hypothetical protein